MIKKEFLAGTGLLAASSALCLRLMKKVGERLKKQQEKEKGYHHKCAVCGRTDTDYPDLQFRYCSKCAGYHCFCSDHIFNHVHFTDEQP